MHAQPSQAVSLDVYDDPIGIAGFHVMSHPKSGCIESEDRRPRGLKQRTTPTGL